MEDVGRVPADLTPANMEPATIPTVDGWIESLMNCERLAEADVQRLCDKVRHFFCRLPFPHRPWSSFSLPRANAQRLAFALPANLQADGHRIQPIPLTAAMTGFSELG